MKINLDSFEYHPQELAFFSWFFDSLGANSLGAEGKYSSKGTFTAPSAGCPSQQPSQ